MAGRLFPPGEPEPGSRLHQPAGKEDRRPRRLRAVRRTPPFPRLRPQDFRRRGDQCPDLARRRGADGLRREISGSGRCLHQGRPRGQCLGAGEPRKAGELWVDGEGIASFSSPACTLGAYADLKAKGKKITVAYVFDTERGIKLFADQAFFAVGGKDEIAPFLLKKDAEAHAAKIGGKVVNFTQALKSAMSGG